ncbi:MAG: RNA polymerase sigma factor [Armatimonadota bacterium]|jgi:RNA polymerase sigma-70 factor (ECF subfamily)
MGEPDSLRRGTDRDGPNVADRHLAALARGGDDDAFDLLIERHLGSIQRLCWSMLCNRSDAEDAAQETFVRAYRCLSRYDAGRSFAPWLRGIATKVCLQALRNRSRHAGREVSLDASYLEPVAPEPREASPLATRAVQALATLPETYRLPLALFYLEDASVAEVADALGISQGAARVRLHRGREQIRDILMKQAGDGDGQA